MKLTESQLREVVRHTIRELFVRPTRRAPIVKRSLSTTYSGGYGDEGLDINLGGDIGFGEFDETDQDNIDEDDGLNEQNKKDSGLLPRA